MKNKLANLRSVAPARKNVILPALLPPVALFVLGMLLCASMLAATDTEGIYWWPYSVSFWLIVHQVPFYGIGPTGYLTVVGLLPLLPTIGYIALLALAARTFTSDERPEDTQLYAAIAIITPLLIALLSWVTLRASASEIFVQAPNPIALFGFVLGTTLIGLFAGLRSRTLHIIPYAKETFPSWGTEGFRIVGRLAALLLFFGSVAAFVSLLVHWDLLGDVLMYGTTAAGILSFGFLTLLYLPNMAIAGAIILSGGGLRIGTTHASLYSTNISELPALPAFAALPQGEAQWWWLLFLVVPIISTILATKDVHGETFPDRIKAILFSAITTASLFALGAWVAGGSIGVMGRVSMSEALIGLVLAVWILVIGTATVFSTAGPHAESWDTYRKRRAAQRKADRAAAAEETSAAEETPDVEEAEEAEATEEAAVDGAESVDSAVDDTENSEEATDTPEEDATDASDDEPEQNPEKADRETPDDGLD
ncbi:MAG: DUF6350 family protein [Lawsonella sp.]